MTRAKKTRRLPTKMLTSVGDPATKKATRAVTPSPTAIHQYTSLRNALARSAAASGPTTPSHGLSDSFMVASSPRSLPRSPPPRSGLEQHLHGAILLAIEDGVSAGRLRQGKGVGDDGVGPELPGPHQGHQRGDVVAGVADAHAQGEVLEEGLARRERDAGLDVHADGGDATAR